MSASSQLKGAMYFICSLLYTLTYSDFHRFSHCFVLFTYVYKFYNILICLNLVIERLVGKGIYYLCSMPLPSSLLTSVLKR